MKDKRLMWAIHFGNSPTKARALPTPSIGLGMAAACFVFLFVALAVIGQAHGFDSQNIPFLIPVTGAMVNAQAIAAELEKVRGKPLQAMYNRDDTTFALFEEKTDMETVGPRAMRVPLQIRPGGKFKQIDPDGGELGRGSGSTYEVATLTPFTWAMVTEITKLVEWATNSKEKAIENLAKKEIPNSMKMFRRQLDALIQGSGDCVMGVISGVAGDVLTLADPHRADLLYFNQTVQVWNAALTVDRGSSSIVAIDYNAGTIELDTAPGGTIATDVIVIDGVAVPTPSGLRGIKYHHSDAATGSWQGLNRADFPEVRTPHVDAGNSALSTGPVRLALNLVRKALGENALTGETMLWHWNVEQEDANEAQKIAISQIFKEASAEQKVDLFFQQNGPMAGVATKVNTKADPLRIDLLMPKHWGRGVMAPLDFLTLGDEGPLFAVRASDGGVAMAYIFHYVISQQVFQDNPRAGAYIDNLARPDGYVP